MTVYLVTYGCGDYYCDGEHVAGIWTDRLTAESVLADFAKHVEPAVTEIELDPAHAAIPHHLRAGYRYKVTAGEPTDGIIPVLWAQDVAALTAPVGGFLARPSYLEQP